MILWQAQCAHLWPACGFPPGGSQDTAFAKNRGAPGAELLFHFRGKAFRDLWWISSNHFRAVHSCISHAEQKWQPLRVSMLPERIAGTHGSCVSKSSWLLPGEMCDLRFNIQMLTLSSFLWWLHRGMRMELILKQPVMS